MAYTPVTALVAPSRGGDPDNFPGEAAVYLGALATYAPGVQALTTYLNALPLRLYQWGQVTESSTPLAVPATLAAFPARSPSGDSGAVRVAKRDAFIAASETLSTRQNQIGTFLDAINVICGSPAFEADASRPVVPTVTAAPLRGDAPATFESKDQAFYNSLATHNDTITLLSNYYSITVTPENWDLITAAVDATDDFGLITETANG